MKILSTDRIFLSVLNDYIIASTSDRYEIEDCIIKNPGMLTMFMNMEKQILSKPVRNPNMSALIVKSVGINRFWIMMSQSFYRSASLDAL